MQPESTTRKSIEYWLDLAKTETGVALLATPKMVQWLQRSIPQVLDQQSTGAVALPGFALIVKALTGEEAYTIHTQQPGESTELQAAVSISPSCVH